MLQFITDFVERPLKRIEKMIFGESRQPVSPTLPFLIAAVSSFCTNTIFLDVSSILWLTGSACSLQILQNNFFSRIGGGISQGLNPNLLNQYHQKKNKKLYLVMMGSLATYGLVLCLKPSPESLGLLQFCGNMDENAIINMLVLGSGLLGYFNSQKIVKLIFPVVAHFTEQKALSSHLHQIYLQRLEEAPTHIDQDFDIEATDENGIPILISAISNREYHAATRLILDGANVNTICTHSQKGAIWYAARNVAEDESLSKNSNDPQNYYLKGTMIIKLLLEHGADIRQLDDVLFYSVKHNAVNLAKMLLELGVDGSATRRDRTAITARVLRKPEWIEMLASHFEEHYQHLIVPTLRELTANAIYKKNGLALPCTEKAKLPSELLHFYDDTPRREQVRPTRIKCLPHFQAILTIAQAEAREKAQANASASGSQLKISQS